MSLAIIRSATLLGVDGVPVTVEVHVGKGLPGFTVVGLPDASCREARDRVRAAVLASGFDWPDRRTTVNLAPSGLRKVGAGLDVAIAIGVLVADDRLGEHRPDLAGLAMLGELGLDGALRPVPGVLSMVRAVAVDSDAVVVSPWSAREARLVHGPLVRPVATLRELVAALTGTEPWPDPDEPPAPPPPPPPPDLADVRGQPVARFALEVAAAGGHHLLMVGPPGAGKTMLASRLPGLLPPLDGAGALEATAIHSAAGAELPPGGLVSHPPFRAPHHSSSSVALVGGGSARMRPGEISLAHATPNGCRMNRHTPAGQSQRMTRAAIYARISDDRNDTRLGVTRQQADCADLIARNGWHLHDTHIDNDTSAYRGRPRPAYQTLCDQVKNNEVDVVVAWHPDRLHRSPRELEDFIDLLEATGTTVATVTAGDWDLATPEGRAMARIVGAIARKESEDKSRRLRRKHAELAAAGLPAGGGTRPFGFEADQITHRPDEADLIRYAVDAVLAGRSIRGLCVEFAERGIRTPSGKAWRSSTFRDVLQNPRIAGWRAHHGALYRAVWDPIVDEETWQRVCAVLRDPARRVNEGARRYLLSGMVWCGSCGGRLAARPRQDKVRRYVCVSGPGFGGCGKVHVLAEALEEYVVAAVVDLARDLPTVGGGDGSGWLLGELADVEARLAEVARDHYVDRVIGRVQFQAATAALEARAQDLRGRVAREQQAALWQAQAGVGLGERWEALGFDQQRAVVGAVVDRVTVAPVRVRGRNRFDPARVSITWRA